TWRHHQAWREAAVRVQQLRAMLDDAAMFLRDTREKSRHILERDERHVERVAKPDESRALERRRDVEHPRERRGVIPADPHRPAREPREADDQVAPVVGLNLEKLA